MRVRLSLKFFLKSFVVIVLLLFILPLFYYHLDSDEDRQLNELRKRSEESRKNIVKKDLEFQEKRREDHLIKRRMGDVIHMAPESSKHGKVGLQVPDGERMVIAQPGELEHPLEKHGPKQELKTGIIGNFEPTDYKGKAGPGEGGESVYTSMQEKTAADQSVREFGFNMVASDKIAMDRTIPDTRMDECKYWHYPEQLPTASVIIVFHNEGWSTLLRTVHSVINMSPPHLLHEIVMVDDFSNKEHLKERLEKYLEQFEGKVKLFRNPERKGLIGTRTLGAKYATGDVILFLDAHCECNRNWLPPLLARIAYDRTIMAVPTIDGIDWNSFSMHSVYAPGSHYRGIFEWGFLYKESSVPKRERDKRQHKSEPYWSPTHAGGLFAMDRKYFFELGAYDPGLQIWGGENFELSFKIWQCGGSIEWVPCSRVGHVYRNSMPYGFGDINPKIPIILLNYMRVVEVWLDDEFKEYFYTREPTIRGYPIGNITDQLQFKRTHNCKSFKWFMENIAYEVTERFPYPPPNIGWGEIKLKHGSECWDSMGNNRPGGSGSFGVSRCHHLGGNQLFRLNVEGQLAVGEWCVDVKGDGITMVNCGVKPSGPWQLVEGTDQIQHKTKDKCVEATGGSKLGLRSCDSQNIQQQWQINEIRTWST